MATELQIPVRQVSSINPATGKSLGEFACASEEEVRAAVARARVAQPAWSEGGVRERIAVLKKFQQLLHEAKAEIARLITSEAGKPYAEALTTEVNVVLDAARFYI